jgi:hypothetical protein
MVSQIPGYIYGSRELPQAPVSDEEFKLLKSTVLMTDEDVRYLRMAGEVLKDQVEDVLDLWYGWVGSNKHLVYYFGDRKIRTAHWRVLVSGQEEVWAMDSRHML